MPKIATLEMRIQTFRAYQPNATGDGGSLQVMTSSATPGAEDVTYAVIDSGGGLLSLDANGGLRVSKTRKRDDDVRIVVIGPDQAVYRPQGLVARQLSADGIDTQKSPFGEFDCRGNQIVIRDAEDIDTGWEFFVLVQRIAKLPANPKAFNFTFGLIDPRIQNQ
ncbi:MAG: hypothetical protein RLY71_4133 [Pseudomonadota bacterium]|jgi:hypothetical protein